MSRRVYYFVGGRLDGLTTPVELEAPPPILAFGRLLADDDPRKGDAWCGTSWHIEGRSYNEIRAESLPLDTHFYTLGEQVVCPRCAGRVFIYQQDTEPVFNGRGHGPL
jgi:hypothetical protein